MDMTSSAVLNGGGITSQNNSNNKSPSTQVMVHSSQVDDSPINSPEFLPANSVSYHQVHIYKQRFDVIKFEFNISTRE